MCLVYNFKKPRITFSHFSWVNYSEGDLIVIMAADLQTTKLIPDLIEEWEDNQIVWAVI